MPEPTNSELLAEIRSNAAVDEQRWIENSKELGEIKMQVKKTNGRVTILERWKDKYEAIQEYKKENPIQVSKADNVNIKSVWLSEGGQKIFLAIAALITAVATIVTLRGGA